MNNTTAHEPWLLVSDVDDTLVGDDSSLRQLADVLEEARHQGLTVAYNSSRPCASLRETLSSISHLPTPDYLIGALGTEIQDGESGDPVEAYTRHIGRDWQRQPVVEIADEFGFRPHPEKFQTSYKASFDIPGREAYERFKQRLDQEGLTAKVIFSGRTNLDVIPIDAGKGEVIKFLRDFLDVPPEHVVVAGDSGNDVDMFVAPNRGIVVGNADEDLKQYEGEHIYHASATHAGGVLEGLRHWGAV